MSNDQFDEVGIKKIFCFGTANSGYQGGPRREFDIDQISLVGFPTVRIQASLGSVISIDRGSRVPAAAALSASAAAISITDRMPSASDPLMITSAASRSAPLALESAGSMTKLPCAASMACCTPLERVAPCRR